MSNRVEKNVKIDRMYLDWSNPRHDPFDSDAETIEYLCDNENIYQLACDIKKHGLVPLERFALTRMNGDKKDNENTDYKVAEGNRRLCALKLLRDPDLAPRKKRHLYKKLAEGWEHPIEQIPAVIFEDENDLNLCLERTHLGFQDGVGRKPWSAVQKERHSGGAKYSIAFALLKYGKRKGMISVEQEKGRISTIQRYVSNPALRSSLGLDTGNSGTVRRVVTAEDFELLVRKFFQDLLAAESKITSRANSEVIKKYAQELSLLEGQSRQPIDPPVFILDDEEESVEGYGSVGSAGGGKSKNGRRKDNRKKDRVKPNKNTSPDFIPCSKALSKALKSVGSWKIEHLYNSICNVRLKENTPLLAVGVWSLIECLTSRAGRNDGQNFHAFLSPDLLHTYGLGKKSETKDIRDTVERIQKCGNTTKHHDIAATFNSDQLVNDWEVVTPLLIKVAESVQDSGS
ncbi:MAG: hypothetical protein M3009_03295 [Bombella apis]|uniref:hypothetical protein n=1 Tax=Bombella apis TaxID=1785988 RepID=UPI0023F423C8|nr:hypothetical protein [Bombella apis]MCT6819484.1 hypothetical protein [Bombella apis]